MTVDFKPHKLEFTNYYFTLPLNLWHALEKFWRCVIIQY